MEIPNWWFKYPLEKILEKTGYYKKYRKVYFSPIDNDLTKIYGKFKGGKLTLPKGIAGFELLEIRKKLKEKYNMIENNTGEEEVKKRGADI
jgi:hypothetical protein